MNRLTSSRVDRSAEESKDREIRTRLLSWFKSEKRELPWRGTSDPYRIWVSEVMLQQTTVGAVHARYDGFLTKFPDISSLADAPEDDVLAAWSGLGYYARARNLRSAAKIINAEHGGRVPSDPAALRRLPGFGEYMSAAVAALAFGARLPAADANVERVLSRLFAIEGLAGTRAHRNLVLAHAARLLPAKRPGDFTAAIMDLGQTICTPRRPGCFVCPLRDQCCAFAEGDPERYPRKAAKPAMVRVALAAADVRSGKRALLVRRAGGWLAGMWEFPSAEGRTAAGARQGLARRLESLSVRMLPGGSAGTASHTVVRRRLEIDIYRGAPRRGRNGSDGAGGGRWFLPEELERAAIPTLTRKIAKAAGFLPSPD